jgi:transcription elongation factor GreA-like protein
MNSKMRKLNLSDNWKQVSSIFQTKCFKNGRVVFARNWSIGEVAGIGQRYKLLVLR